MSEADFNVELAKLQAGADALAAAVAQNPELAAQLAAVMSSATADAELAEQQAQEAAKANALRVLNDRVMQTLAAAVAQPEPEGENEPEGDLEP